MREHLFAKNFNHRLNERQVAVYRAGIAYPLEGEVLDAAKAAGVLAPRKAPVADAVEDPPPPQDA